MWNVTDGVTKAFRIPFPKIKMLSAALTAGEVKRQLKGCGFKAGLSVSAENT